MGSHESAPRVHQIQDITFIYHVWFRKISIFSFFLVSERAEFFKCYNLLGSESGRFLRSCLLNRTESLAASFTSLFVVCEISKNRDVGRIFCLMRK